MIDTTGLTLSGTNTYAGTTTLEDGLFTVSNTHTLGGGEVYVDTSAALGLSNGITLAQNMTILGNGVAGHGAIDIVTGQDVLTGTITLDGPRRQHRLRPDRGSRQPGDRRQHHQFVDGPPDLRRGQPRHRERHPFQHR